MNDTSGCAKNVHYGDILVKFGESISAEKADLPFICEREILKKLSKSILKNGDVVIADTAEDMTTGKSCEIVDVDECMPVLAGLHTIPVRPKQKFGKYYLGYYLNSEAFHSQLIPLIQGIKVYSISKSSIKDTVVMFPDDVQEQEKIGSLFNRIDNTITLQQRKLNSLQKLKKGLLQKMFPKNGENIPEIRFPEFSDAWKQRKLCEFVNFYSGLTYKPEDVNQIGTFVLRSSNVKNGEILDADNVYVNEDIAKSEKVQLGDIIVVVRNGSRDLIGKHATVKRSMPNTVIGAFMTGIRAKEYSFVNALLDTNQFEKEINKNLGATINQITGYMFSNMSFTIPSEEEQHKIGSFFTQLDNTITLQQRKLESLQKLKKGLLQQMFI